MRIYKHTVLLRASAGTVHRDSTLAGSCRGLVEGPNLHLWAGKQCLQEVGRHRWLQAAPEELKSLVSRHSQMGSWEESSNFLSLPLSVYHCVSHHGILLETRGQGSHWHCPLTSTSWAQEDDKCRQYSSMHFQG